MKLQVGKTVYLQGYELNYPRFPPDVFPKSFSKEAPKQHEIFLVPNPEDRFKFIHAFKDPKNTAWLMSQDWIVDYDQCMEMSLSELKAYYKKVKQTYDAEINQFKNQNLEYRTKHIDTQSLKFGQTEHKIYSLEIMIKHRSHQIQFVLPDGTVVPNTFRQKLNHFLARLFGLSAQ